MSPRVSESAVAFFCLVDGPGYLPKAITALRSVQRFHPDAGYFVVGRFGEDRAAVELVERFGLTFRQLDLSHVFADTTAARPHRLARRFPRVTWPSECFWWVDAPRLFGESGYAYSCALDGDTLGVAPLVLTEAFGGAISGVRKPNGEINSGVLFLDNEALLADDLGGRALRTYRTDKRCDHPGCIGFCRTLSDQTLLQRMEQRGDVAVRAVGNAYNHMLFWDEEAYLDKNPDAPFGIDETRIAHLLSKPWNPPVRRGTLNPIMRDGYAAWWAFARELWPDDRQRTELFGPERTIALGRSLTRLLRP